MQNILFFSTRLHAVYSSAKPRSIFYHSTNFREVTSPCKNFLRAYKKQITNSANEFIMQAVTVSLYNNFRMKRLTESAYDPEMIKRKPHTARKLSLESRP